MVADRTATAELVSVSALAVWATDLRTMETATIHIRGVTAIPTTAIRTAAHTTETVRTARILRRNITDHHQFILRKSTPRQHLLSLSRSWAIRLTATCVRAWSFQTERL